MSLLQQQYVGTWFLKVEVVERWALECWLFPVSFNSYNPRMLRGGGFQGHWDDQGGNILMYTALLTCMLLFHRDCATCECAQ